MGKREELEKQITELQAELAKLDAVDETLPESESESFSWREWLLGLLSEENVKHFSEALRLAPNIHEISSKVSREAQRGYYLRFPEKEDFDETPYYEAISEMCSAFYTINYDLDTAVKAMQKIKPLLEEDLKRKSV